MIENCVKVVILVAIVYVAYFDRHLVSLFVALDSLLRVGKLTLRERPDAAVDTNFAFHVFKLVEQALALRLLLLVLGRDLIELSCALLQLLLDQLELFFESNGFVGCLAELLCLFLQSCVLFL